MVLSALRDGVRRVNRAPAVLFGVAALTVLLALPLGLVVREMIGESLGASLAANAAADGVNADWWSTFSEHASGLGVTFTPRIIGFGAVASNISAVLDARPQALTIMGVGAVYLLLWTFLAGGIIDRYARNRPVRAAAFFSACGVYFFRFLRLAVLAAAGYLVLFGLLHRWLFDGLYPWLIRDWTVERDAFFLRLALYAVFGAALLALNLWFDYAKVRAVVEDRRSMIGALVAACRFIRRQPAQTAGLYLANAALFLLVVALYAAFASNAGRAGWHMWAALAVSQLYLLGRIWVKLVFWASETSLFQSLLAHADYVAARLPVWPDSPSAEAIDLP